MDTSIRLYTSNSRLNSIIDAKQPGRPTTPLSHEEDSLPEAASIDEEERATDTIAQQSVHVLEVLQEQAQRVDVADFETIFLRFQGPITNFIYHMIGNREQACDLAQDVFVKAYKALLGGTVVQQGALSESGGAASDGFNSNADDGSNEGRSNSISSLYERGSYDGGRSENRVANREIVQRIFRELPPQNAVCLWLYENDGLSCAQIAETLNISASAVKMRLMRARERFITLYKQEVGDQ